MRHVEMDLPRKRISFLRRFKLPLCMLFSFLLGCMFAINLVPIEKTCRIDVDADRELNIMRNSRLKNPELIIMVMSDPRNADRRHAIRETWMKLVDEKSNRFKHFFVVGTFDLNDKVSSNLAQEQKSFKDVLMLPIKDSYQNLTLKVLKSFEWLNGETDYEGFTFKYVLKCDDDSFVKLDSLIHEIQHIELLFLKSRLTNVLEMSLMKDSTSSSPFISINVQTNADTTVNNLSVYWGYFDGRASIKSAGKWRDSNWIACDKYIPYALGGGYILSKALVTYIARNVDYLRMYKSEDVSVGFWLASLKNILRIHDIRFDTEWESRGCKNFHLISHNLNINKMKEMFSRIKQKGVLCPNETLVRNFYIYNWTALPSHCCIRHKFENV